MSSFLHKEKVLYQQTSRIPATCTYFFGWTTPSFLSQVYIKLSQQNVMSSQFTLVHVLCVMIILMSVHNFFMLTQV